MERIKTLKVSVLPTPPPLFIWTSRLQTIFHFFNHYKKKEKKMQLFLKQLASDSFFFYSSFN